MDTRNLSEGKPLHSLEFHDAEILSLCCSPCDESIVVTGDVNGMVCYWDLSYAKSEKAKEGVPSDLLFVHGGHNEGVSDISMHSDVPNLTLSCAGHDVQAWTPSNKSSFND
ncbi:hypothetical protein P9112_007006 [Eukaryota sp. TZLM1-RC]